MNFVGTAIRATPADIDRIAADLKVEPAAFRAVLEVEAAGSGFDKRNRPKALFERHHFFRNLKDDPGLQSRAVAEGLAYPKWGEKPYPKGSDAVYDEITRACAIDEDDALLSTSWGLGQVMGMNHRLAGCKSVRELVEQAKASEANQLQHVANFIWNSGLQDELMTKNWAKFARGYNGPGYAQNQYDVKLARAYAKFSKGS
jgi:hypothetical protein